MKKILIIEDEPDFLEELTCIFEYEQYEVIKAINSDEGINLINEKCPDLILCDILMNRSLQGFYILEKIKTNSETSIIPFIIISALTERKYIRKAKDLGADEYLIKPFSLEELLNVVKTYFNKSGKIQNNLQQFRA